MNKKAILLFILSTILGSVICYNAGNFIFADVGNNAYGYNGLNILATIPGFMFALESIAISMLIIRYYNSNLYRKRTLLLYMRILISFSIIGVIGAITSAIYSYGTLFSSNPFPFYIIICLVVHLIIIIGLFIAYHNVKKNMVDDPQKRSITLTYVIYSIFLPGFMFFAYNRFGAVLFMFTYVQTSTLYMTWPLYVWLITPIMLIYYILAVEFNIYQNKLIQVIHLLCILILNVSIGISYFISTAKNSLYISAVSPAFGLDRLATTPIVVNFHMYFMIFVLIVCLIRLIIIKNKKEN